jgi:hypothetical protein
MPILAHLFREMTTASYTAWIPQIRRSLGFSWYYLKARKQSRHVRRPADAHMTSTPDWAHALLHILQRFSLFSCSQCDCADSESTATRTSILESLYVRSAEWGVLILICNCSALVQYCRHGEPQDVPRSFSNAPRGSPDGIVTLLNHVLL